jgi:hypothetical protein
MSAPHCKGRVSGYMVGTCRRTTNLLGKSFPPEKGLFGFLEEKMILIFVTSNTLPDFSELLTGRTLHIDHVYFRFQYHGYIFHIGVKNSLFWASKQTLPPSNLLLKLLSKKDKNRECCNNYQRLKLVFMFPRCEEGLWRLKQAPASMKCVQTSSVNCNMCNLKYFSKSKNQDELFEYDKDYWSTDEPGDLLFPSGILKDPG